MHKKHRLDRRLLAAILILTGLLFAVGSHASAQDAMFQEQSLSLQAEQGVPPPPADPLWKQVRECIQKAIIANSFVPAPNPAKLPSPPCIWVFRPMDTTAQLGNGYTILKDTSANKPFGFLTVAAKAITGIEDPQVDFFAGQPPSSYSRNYFASGWSALGPTVQTLYQQTHQKTLGPDRMGLTINSMAARTLNQFHIHMSCMNKAVHDILANKAADFSTTKWTKVALPNGHTYSVILLADFSQNPFLVMQTVPGYTQAGLETLAVTGTNQALPTTTYWRTMPTVLI